MRILVLEPDEYYHQHFAEKFQDIGEIIIKTDGSEITKALHELKPDVLVMELLLPSISGFEVLESVRQVLPNYRLPIVVYSQIENLEDVQAALSFGISGYLVKGKDTLRDLKNLLLNLTSVKMTI